MEFAPVINLSSLDGKNGFRLDGVEGSDFIGSAVASAGDVNGDGFDDLILGSFRYDPNNSGASPGASFVVFGKAGGFDPAIDLSALDGTDGFRLDGAAAGDSSGRSVASAGDVNGDGFDDLIVGAEGADPNSEYYAGSSYVVFGHAGGFDPTIDLGALDGTDGFRLDGAAAFDVSGRSVASAGDVNGDGLDDLIVGAFRADGQAGSSYVVFGKRGVFDPALDLGALDGTDGFRLDGAAAGDSSGRSVASAGDVNGDGFDDLIVGASSADPNGAGYAGSSYVVFGKAGVFDAALDLGALDGTDGFRLDGVRAADGSGSSVASAGDVNGDGFDDLIVGAPQANPNGEAYAGSSYVVFGKRGGFDPALDPAALNGRNGFRLDGAAAGDASGYSVASAGDVNGDGFDDLIVGAPEADPNGGVRTGSSYVVFGKARGFDPTLDFATLDGADGFRLDGAAGGDRSGVSVASAGDVDGDGFDDLIVGADFADPGGDLSAGSSYVVFGRAPDAAVTRVGSAADQAIRGGVFDDVLSGLGGDDSLFGGSGADRLRGGDGADELTGGRGFDRMVGGAGADTFVFVTRADTAPPGPRDRIGDFAGGVDLIDLSGIDADGRRSDGDDAFTFIGADAFSGESGELRYKEQGGNTFVEADVDGDGRVDLRIRLDGVIAPTADDFIL